MYVRALRGGKEEKERRERGSGDRKRERERERKCVRREGINTAMVAAADQMGVHLSIAGIATSGGQHWGSIINSSRHC